MSILSYVQDVFVAKKIKGANLSQFSNAEHVIQQLFGDLDPFDRSKLLDLLRIVDDKQVRSGISKSLIIREL